MTLGRYRRIRVYEAKTGARCGASFVPQDDIASDDLDEMIEQLLSGEIEVEEIPVDRQSVRIPVMINGKCIGYIVFFE